MFGLKSVYLWLFNNFTLFLKVSINMQKYANDMIQYLTIGHKACV